MDNNKKIHVSKLKITIIMIDIIVIIVLIGAYLINLKTKSTLQDETTNKETNVAFQFKEFAYYAPSGIKLKKNNTDDDKFELITSNYTASIEPYIDINKNMKEIINDYYNNMENKYDSEVININDYEALKYKLLKSDEIVYYISIKYPFVYEIKLIQPNEAEIQNDIEMIVKILEEAQYNSNSSNNFTYSNIKAIKEKQE